MDRNPRERPKKITVNNQPPIVMEASKAFVAGHYRIALTKYKLALDTLSRDDNDTLDTNIIRYLVAACLLECNEYRDLLEALDHLLEVESKIGDRFPAVYYCLAKIYKQLYRFDEAQQKIKDAFALLSQGKTETHLVPGTTTVIGETTKEVILDSLLKLRDECTNWRRPDVKCCLSNCRNVLKSNVPNRNMFYSDPAFNGYISVICSKSPYPCVLKYHPVCWEYQKEHGKPTKLSDKDVIGYKCFTANCQSDGVPNRIIRIEIFGSNAKLQYTIEGEDSFLPLPKEAPKGAIKKNLTQQLSKLRRPHQPAEAVLERIKSPPPVPRRSSPKEQSGRKRLSSTPVKDIPEENPQETHEIMYCNEYVQVRVPKHLADPNFSGYSPEIAQSKTFIFGILYEFIKAKGPTYIREVEEKWLETMDMIPDIHSTLDVPDIAKFLLSSPKIAMVGKYLCLPQDLPQAYILTQTNTGTAFHQLITDAFLSEQGLEEDSGSLTPHYFDKSIKRKEHQAGGATKDSEELEAACMSPLPRSPIPHSPRFISLREMSKKADDAHIAEWIKNTTKETTFQRHLRPETSEYLEPNNNSSNNSSNSNNSNISNNNSGGHEDFIFKFSPDESDRKSSPKTSKDEEKCYEFPQVGSSVPSSVGSYECKQERGTLSLKTNTNPFLTDDDDDDDNNDDGADAIKKNYIKEILFEKSDKNLLNKISNVQVDTTCDLLEERYENLKKQMAKTKLSEQEGKDLSLEEKEERIKLLSVENELLLQLCKAYKLEATHTKKSCKELKEKQIKLKSKVGDFVQEELNSKYALQTELQQKDAEIQSMKTEREESLEKLQDREEQLSCKEEEIKKLREKHDTVKRSILRDLLEYIFLAQKQYLERNTDHCSITLQIIDYINTALIHSNRLSIVIDKTEWFGALQSWHKIMIESQSMYNKFKQKIESNEVEGKDDIMLPMNDVPKFPSKDITDIVRDGITELFKNLTPQPQLHFQQPEWQIIHPSIVLPRVPVSSLTPLPLSLTGQPLYQNPVTQYSTVLKPHLIQTSNITEIHPVCSQNQQILEVERNQIENDKTCNNDTSTEVENKFTRSTDLKDSEAPQSKSNPLENEHKINNNGTVNEYKNEVRNEEEGTVCGNKFIEMYREACMKDKVSETVDNCIDTSKEVDKIYMNQEKDEKIQHKDNKIMEKLKTDITISNGDAVCTSKVEAAKYKDKTPKSNYGSAVDNIMDLLRNEYPGIMDLDLLESLCDTMKTCTYNSGKVTVEHVVDAVRKNILNRQKKYLCTYDDAERNKPKETKNVQTKVQTNAQTNAQQSKKKNKTKQQKQPNVPTSASGLPASQPHLVFDVLSKETIKGRRERQISISSTSSGSSVIKEPKPAWVSIPQVNGTWKKEYIETECIICMDSIETKYSAYTLSCQHTFHKKCIKNWFQQNQSCPNCRKYCTMDEEYPPLP